MNRFEIPDPEDIFGDIDDDWEPGSDELADMVAVWGQNLTAEDLEHLPFWELDAEPTAEDLAEFADLIPDLDDLRESAGGRHNWMDEVAAALEAIPMEDAYARWCGKMAPRIGKGQVESIHISCPRPEHPDKQPSAWMNIDKGTWFCGGCNIGGDRWDLASFAKGISIGEPGSRDGEKFIELMATLAGDFGIDLVQVNGRWDLASNVPPVIEIEDDEPGIDNVVVMPTPEAEAYHAEAEQSRCDWRDMIPRGTFLHEYMATATKVSPVIPPEWHLMLGLSMCGLAVGHRVQLKVGASDSYTPNLFICLVGGTGVGKTRSIGMATKVLREAFPFDFESPETDQVKIIATPGSAEALIDEFCEYAMGSDGEQELIPVKGMLVIDELSELAAKANRKGSSLTPTLIQFYDAAKGVHSIRSRGGGVVRMRDPFCTAVTSTQPGTVRRFYTENELINGWLNRITFVQGGAGSAASPWNHDSVSWNHTIDLLQRIRSMWSQRGHESHIGFTPEGVDCHEDLWGRRFLPITEMAIRAHNNPSADVDPKYQILARVPNNWHRLLTCMAINELKTEVDPDLLYRAEMLLLPILDGGAGMVWEDVLHDDLGELIDKIVSRIERVSERAGGATSVRLGGNGGVLNTRSIRKYPVEIVNRAIDVGVRIGAFATGVNEDGQKIIWIPNWTISVPRDS